MVYLGSRSAVSGGLIICGRAQSLPALYVGFGVVCGFASGLSYSATMGAVNQWFPDCQGLVSGVMLMGFGFSSFFAGKLFQVWTAADNEAWRQFFVYLGAASVIVLGICGTFIKKPSEEQKLRLGTGKGTGQFGEEVPPSGMVRQPVFWLFYLWAVLDSALGLALISQAVGIARESSVHVSEGTIVSFVGLISVFTGIGRAVFGRMFDKKGRNLVMQSINALLFLMGVALMAALRIKCFPLTAAAFLIGGLAYGGAPTTCSAYVGARFGLQNYPRNFPVVATNLLFSSFGGPSRESSMNPPAPIWWYAQ